MTEKAADEIVADLDLSLLHSDPIDASTIPGVGLESSAFAATKNVNS